MNDKDKVQIFAYKCLLTELIPFVEALDAEGLIRYIEQKWPLSQIVLFANTINMLAACKTLEEQEAWLSGIFHVEALSCFLALGWWGAVAGDERDKIDPLEKTLGQLEETINRKGDGQDYFKRLLEDMRKDIARGADAAEANGAALAEVKADTGFVAGEERRRMKNRKKAAGKAAEARAEAEEGAEEKPYKQRIKEALDKVDDQVAKGKQDLEACRYVCKHYGEKKDPRTGEIIFKGGLNKMNGDPMPPETLRDYYRKRRKGTRTSK